ncbi:hypothetical protein KZP23_08070 [Echinicola marina]|uniref:hypothetical protein n=1 Tax=Echinicola marina TaxID=2859768 RepID=UPI001CF6AA86|nr:hypothetical protein [Echinicola marina]UCS94955.1 hypothetical protein KZP23_08070 [Echinicola marina]
MFNFLKSNKKYVPLDKELRKYFENNFLWLMQEFPDPKIEERKILRPTTEDFPIQWNKSQENAFEALDIICGNMQIVPDMIALDFYDNGIKEINMGTSVIFMESDPDSLEAAGRYHHEKVNGKHLISLDQALLEKPDDLIATIAHELSHVKLLGEEKIDQNDEMLTDFTTVFFGLGIFNANTAFQFYNQTDRWGYSNFGYLKIDEWAYALALFAFVRHEDEPGWKQYLGKTIKKDFEKCLGYMIDNEEEIFKFDEEKE